MSHSPLVVIEKVEIHNHNHIDLDEVLHKVNRVLHVVLKDDAAAEALAAENADLKQQLEDALSGANLPPEVQEKVNAIFAASEATKGKLAKAITDNQPAT